MFLHGKIQVTTRAWVLSFQTTIAANAIYSTSFRGWSLANSAAATMVPRVVLTQFGKWLFHFFLLEDDVSFWTGEWSTCYYHQKEMYFQPEKTYAEEVSNLRSSCVNLNFLQLLCKQSQLNDKLYHTVSLNKQVTLEGRRGKGLYTPYKKLNHRCTV